MKKVAAGFVFFLFILLFSFLWHFPTKNFIRYYLWQYEKKTGININCNQSSYTFNRIEMKDVEIFSKNAKIFELNEVSAICHPFYISLQGRKNKGSLKATINSSRANLDLESVEVISDGTKLFRQVGISGNLKYELKTRNGIGKFRIDLKDSLDSFIKSDLVAESNIRFTPGEIYINLVNITGSDIKGKGTLAITVNPREFGNSRLAGTLDMFSGGMSVKIKISGTVNNPAAIPSLGMNNNSSRTDRRLRL